MLISAVLKQIIITFKLDFRRFSSHFFRSYPLQRRHFAAAAKTSILDAAVEARSVLSTCIFCDWTKNYIASKCCNVQFGQSTFRYLCGFPFIM